MQTSREGIGRLLRLETLSGPHRTLLPLLLDWSLLMMMLLAAIVGCAKEESGTAATDKIGIHPSTREAARFGPLEVEVELEKNYGNPFDPKEVEVGAEFISPSGRKFTIPGFYGQDYRLVASPPGKPDRLEEQAPPGWRVRFTPCEEGIYTYRVLARDREGTRVSDPAQLHVRGAAGKGFVRRDPDNPFYFRFDDGSPYVPVGYNYSFHRSPRLADYEERFHSMASVGANWMYVIMDPYDVGLEWGKRPPGRYDLRNCWRLDYILESARQHGILVLLSFNVHADTMPRNAQGWGWWEDHPYNAANGGPCESGDDFFQMEEAKAFYKQRLRYIVARWGHHPNVLGWMPITEIEGSALWNPQSRDRDLNLRVCWYLEMAQYLKQIDPYGHLVSTSLGAASLGPAVDGRLFAASVTDFVQPHIYLFDGFAEDIDYWVHHHRRIFGKPVLVSEFGPTHYYGFDKVKAYLEQDEAMLHHHDGLWTAFFAGGAGTAMHWYWRAAERPAGLNHLRAISRFLKALQWPKGGYMAGEAVVAHWPNKPPAVYQDLLVMPSKDADLSWARGEGKSFHIHPDGRVEGFSVLRAALYSRGWRQANANSPLPVGAEPPTFSVTFPKEALLEITVQQVQGDSARLLVSEKGQIRQEVLLAGLPLPYHLPVPMSAGSHTIHVENSDAGRSVIHVSGYRFANCRETRWAPLLARSLRGEGEWLLWIARTDLRELPLGAFPPQPLAGAALFMPNLPAARYQVEWWDSYSGEVMGKEELTNKGRGLTLALPPISRDIACILRRISRLPGGVS